MYVVMHSVAAMVRVRASLMLYLTVLLTVGLTLTYAGCLR